METLLEYKCPACGGALSFDSSLQKMKCPYCDTEFEIAALQELDEVLKQEQPSEFAWESQPETQWSEEETQDEDQGPEMSRQQRCWEQMQVMEGVGMNLRVILDALGAHQSIDRLTLIGGGAKGALWPQILADIWGVPVDVALHCEEATSMGAAVCAGVGIGLFDSFAAVDSLHHETRSFLPNPEAAEKYRALLPLFEQAYASLRGVFRDLSQFREGERL